MSGNGLTRNEIIQLLAVLAALDGVDTDDPVMVSAWHEMSEIGGWESYQAARRALLVYRDQQPNFPVKPGHITEILQRVRKTSSATFDLALERVPDEVRYAEDFDARYMAWVKGRAAEHRAQHMADFAVGKVAAPKAIEA